MHSAFQYAALTLALGACVALAGKINHVVVLMEENRSFDHLLGSYNRTKRGTVDKGYYNDVKLKNGTVIRVPVTYNAPYVNYCDPDHGLPPTSYKIFGHEKPNDMMNETMLHFAQWEYDHAAKHETKLMECNVMEGFAPGMLPVITALADEFVLFDNFFASVPGPTWPNRMFFMAATSEGLTETGPWYRDNVGQLFPGRTIFDQVHEAGGSWALYYDDTPWELFMETLAHHPENMRTMAQFYEDAASGNLPAFAFMNPRAGVNLTLNAGSNDQHPDHDVTLGEKLYRDVYQALRHSPKWNETLFVLTYDEHGGFFDHVHPPRPVPAPVPGRSGDFPDAYPDSFNFTRGGIRIPTILISPWLPRGLIVTDPPAAQKPDETSVYELTSIIATTRKLLDVLNRTEPLTKRDAWAATFEHLFDMLDTPRTDCPDLPAAPVSMTRDGLEAEAKMPINPLQQHIMGVHANLAGVPYPAHVQQQGDVDAWNQRHFAVHRDKTLAWKASKHHVQEAQRRRYADEAPIVVGQTKGSLPYGHKKPPRLNSTYLVVVMPLVEDSLARSWEMHVNASAGRRITVVTKLDKTPFCLDSANAREGDIVGISECYPSVDPVLNRDKAQHWNRFGDASLRPASNTSLCATTTLYTELGGDQLVLMPCTNAVSQHFSWQDDSTGPVQPDSAKGVMYFGDDINSIQIVRAP